MKLSDLKTFRQPGAVKKLLKKLHAVSVRPVTIMEVCGTHTMSIFRHGIRDLLPETISLISGPGCPVCVTSQGYIDTALSMSSNPDIILTTFGDMMKVPGDHGTLHQQRAGGRDIRIVYSPLDAVQTAIDNPDKDVVFLAVGFETTAPVIALAVSLAAEKEVKNFSILHSIKTMPETMKVLLEDPDLNVDGFLCPGHVSAVIGVNPYNFIAEDYSIPAVVAGFEPVDIIQALIELVEMIENNEPAVVNSYSRLVKQDGNATALEMIDKSFLTSDSYWRGLGRLPNTGYTLREELACYDAELKFGLKIPDKKSPEGCSCGDILKGKKTPLDCKLFRTACSPENPIGACMVSEEGTCAAYYKYHL